MINLCYCNRAVKHKISSHVKNAIVFFNDNIPSNFIIVSVKPGFKDLDLYLGKTLIKKNLSVKNSLLLSVIYPKPFKIYKSPNPQLSQ